jgi:hypothetical protein
MSSGLTPAEIAVALKINSDDASIGDLTTKLDAVKARLAALDKYPMDNTAKGLASAASSAGNAEAQFIRAERAVTLLGAGFTRMIPGTGALGSEMAMLGRGVAGAATSFGLLNAVMLGAGIAGIVAMGAAFAELISKGVQLNETLEKTKEIVASNLLGEASATYGGKAGAQQAATASMDDLTQASQKLQVPISQTTDLMAKLNGEMTLSGASLQQQVTLVTQLSAAQTQISPTYNQLVSDMKQLLNGRVNDNNQVAVSLNLSKQQVLAARENGSVVELLTNATRAASQEYLTSSNNYGDASKKLQAGIEQIQITASKPLMQGLIEGINQTIGLLGGSEAQTAATNFGKFIGDMAEGAVLAIKLISSAIQQVISLLGQFTGGLGKFESDSEFKLGQIALDQSKSPVLNTLTLGANKSASEGLANQMFGDVSNRLAEQESLVGPAFQGREGMKYDESYADTDPNQKALNENTAALKQLAAKPPVQAPVGGYPKTPKGPKDKTDSEDQAQIREIQSEINAAQSQYNTLLEKAKVDHELGKTSLDQEYAATLQAGQAYGKALDDGIAKLKQEIDHIKAIGDAQGGLNTKEETQINNLQKAADKAELLKEKLELVNAQNTNIGQWTISMQHFTDSLQLTGTKAAQVFQGEITTAIDGVSKGLTDLIFNSKNVGQAFAQMGESMVSQLLKVMVQQIAFNVLHRQLSAQQLQQDAGTAASGAYSAMASIPYVGPILGAIAAAAAYAGTMAFETFESGGIVGGGYSRKDNRIATVRSGEGILTPEAVHSIGGPATVHAINRMEFAGGFAYGGVVDSPSAMTPSFARSSGGGRDVHVNLFHSMDDLSNHMWNHPDAEHNVLRVVKKGRNSIKV